MSGSRSLEGTSLAAETDGAWREPAESRLQPGLAAPQSRPINNRPQVANLPHKVRRKSACATVGPRVCAGNNDTQPGSSMSEPSGVWLPGATGNVGLARLETRPRRQQSKAVKSKARRGGNSATATGLPPPRHLVGRLLVHLRKVGHGDSAFCLGSRPYAEFELLRSSIYSSS